MCLETARRSHVLTDVVAYEPAVSIAHSIPVGWMAQYRELLNAGDTRGAFACMVKNAGYAPRPLTVMPLWYVRALLRLVTDVRQWKKMEPLLEEDLAEHAGVRPGGRASRRRTAPRPPAAAPGPCR